MSGVSEAGVGATAAVVMDITSSTCRAGFAGGDAPVSTFPCVVGRQRGSEAVFVGEEALRRRREDSSATGKYPVHCGTILNWNDMEEVWRYIYDSELRVKSEDHPLLISEAGNPTVNREMMTRTMFETFNVPSLYIAKRAGLILFASGLTSGFNLHCSSDVSYCTAVYEGHTIPHTFKFSFVGGTEVTYFLMKRLNERGYSLTKGSEYEIVRDIKEKLCYVALDFEQEMQTAASSSSLEKSYKLPDGQVITIGKERFHCPEALFQPTLLGNDDYDSKPTPGIHKVVHDSLTKYTTDESTANIVISGGSTLFPGFSDRLQKELTALAPPAMKIKNISPPHGESSAWIGGSMLASLPSFHEMTISKDEYEEFGPAIVHRKCF